MAETTAAQGRLVAGRYRLGRVLGRGGMGTVWEAHDETLGRDVAVKEVVPPPELTDEQRDLVRQRTMREARAAARIAHPSAVTVHDVVEQDGNPFIVMQLLSPRTLADTLAATGPLSPAAAARVGIDLVDALATAHRAGVLHRDVKPANVMLTDTGRAVLTDFGIATVEDDPTLTSTGMLVGSPAFMAPERARGERPNPASDLWSLGATLFTAVEGEPPFRREGQLPTLNAVLTEEAPPAPHGGPLAAVIAALLSRDPAARPDAVRTRLMLVDAETVASRPAPPPPPPPPPAPAVTVAVADDVRPTVVTEHEVAPPDDARPEEAPQVAPPQVAPPEAAPQVAPPQAASQEDAPPDEPSRPSGRSRALLALVALAVLVAAVAAVAALLRHPGGSPTTTTAGGARATSGSSAGASAGTAPSPSGAASSAAASPSTSTPSAAANPSAAASPSLAGASAGGAGPAPAGFTTYRDPSGFSLAIPQGWVVSHQGTTLYVKEPGGRAYLQVPQTTQPKADSFADWQQQEAYGAKTFHGYQRLRLARVPYKSWDATDWEFLWTPSGGQLHVLDRNVRVSDRRAYALYWSVPAQDWPQRQKDFQEIAASFLPPGS